MLRSKIYENIIWAKNVIQILYDIPDDACPGEASPGHLPWQPGIDSLAKSLSYGPS